MESGVLFIAYFSLNIYLRKQSQKCMTVMVSYTEQPKEGAIYKASLCLAL